LVRWRTNEVNAVTGSKAEQYRRLARECLAAARSASTEEGRTALTDMAQHWFRLAEQQDHESASLDGWAPPPAAEDSRPAAQQQQQVQPTEDDKND
jgi:hypothetical protein